MQDMNKLLEIAKDYCAVKNYVYGRYGGIKGLSKIYPGYTVQNEMTECGLRTQLGLPSVYFYLAVFDALGDIKAQWSHTQNRVLKAMKENAGLTSQDRHYLRFVMKQSQCLESILLGKEIILSGQWGEKIDTLRAGTDEHRLNSYLRRQVRRHLKKMHTDRTDGFSVSERAYRYGDGGIYISVKEKRKRVFIPLTDSNHYTKQLYIRLYPEKGNIEVRIPIETAVKQHEDYVNEAGLAVGIFCMFVTDRGHTYGEKYGEYQLALTDYVKAGNNAWRRNKKNNPGRKKYNAGKARLEAALHTYVNTELNRMLREEKPMTIYVPKLPQSSKAGRNRSVNYSAGLWQRGYIRSRLWQKCREQSIELVEVFGKNISNECSSCGNIGEKKNNNFICTDCGLMLPEKVNAALNALQRGRALKRDKYIREDFADK